LSPKQKDFGKAVADFKHSVSLEPRHKAGWNFLGLCYQASGEFSDVCDFVCSFFNHAPSSFVHIVRWLFVFFQALHCYDKVLTLDAHAVDTMGHAAQACEESSQVEKALKLYQFILLSPGDHHYDITVRRGWLHFKCGLINEAINDFTRGAALRSDGMSALHGLGVSFQAQGGFQKAIDCYDRVLAIDADHRCHFPRTFVTALWAHADVLIQDWNVSNEFHPFWKEAYCKKLPPSALAEVVHDNSLQNYHGIVDVVYREEPSNSNEVALLAQSQAIGVLITSHIPGSINNVRHQRMFGLSVLEMGQWLRRCVRDPLFQVSGRASCHSRNIHTPGWRDLVDVFVKWRSFADPLEPTNWLDELTPETVAEGFALQAAFVNGPMKL
jgi:hypothetical protein